MAGKKGRSGRPRKPIEQHVLSGTYRRDRHGPLPADLGSVRAFPTTVGATALAPDVPSVPAELVEGLSEPGRRFVSQVWAKFEGFNAAECALLRQAGRALDEAELLPVPRERQAASRLFADLTDRLKLREV